MRLLSILLGFINGQQVSGSCRWPWVKSIGTPEEAIEKVLILITNFMFVLNDFLFLIIFLFSKLTVMLS